MLAQRNPSGQPETIFIMLNGRLRRYTLRTMPVYLLDDELNGAPEGQ
jgi:hypothetical protein